MIYNTALTPANQYVETKKGVAGETWKMEQFAKMNSFYRYEHTHRRWEYALCACLIKEFQPKNMINVGGGNSPLSSWAFEQGVEVTEIDPNPPSVRLPGLKYIDDNFPVEGLSSYELVACTSVIEHVENHKRFFVDLLEHSSRVVYLTTDFHPSGGRFSYAHLRTYNAEAMWDFVHLAKPYGFIPYGEVDYRYDGPMVYDYTFAALALVRA